MEYFDPIENREETNFVKTNPDVHRHIYKSEEVYPFWIADMDFRVALPIREQVLALAHRGIFPYEFNDKKLYGSISSWFESRHGLVLNPTYFNQVNSVLTGIAVVIRLFSKPMQGVIINTPVYHMFEHTIKINKRKVVNNALKVDDQGLFVIDFEDLEIQMSKEENKIYLLCNPHNPVGRVWMSEELQKIKSLANKYDVLVLSDEIHADIVYAPNSFKSYINIDRENSVVLLGSPGKTFGLQGVATGHIYSENTGYYMKIRREVESLFIHHDNAFTFYITQAAYNKGSDWLEEFIIYLEDTIGEIQTFLEKYLPQVKLTKPQGTYQLWLDFRDCNLSSEELKDWIFDKAKMGLAPGAQFGGNYELWYRLNIATERGVILKYLKRLYETKPYFSKKNTSDE